jgi:beta-glucosidase
MSDPSAKTFLWVAAASSYRIEDDEDESGRPPSIWDVFARAPGAERNDAGEVACEQYHRYKRDVTLLHILLIQSYRFSISWSPVLSDAEGRPKAELFDFYDGLIDRLAAAGLTPFATLFHWDLPQVLQERGGFAHDYPGGWFSDRETETNARLGKYWIRLNEPSIYACLGHASDADAPDLSKPQMYRVVTHPLNMAQGAALQALRSTDPASRLGSTLNAHRNFVRQHPVIRRPQNRPEPRITTHGSSPRSSVC